MLVAEFHVLPHCCLDFIAVYYVDRLPRDFLCVAWLSVVVAALVCYVCIRNSSRACTQGHYIYMYIMLYVCVYIIHIEREIERECEQTSVSGWC